jgi:hypothetical protein
VVIDSPHAGTYFGGSVAAPIFKRIESTLRYLGIGPTLSPASPVIVARHDEASGAADSRPRRPARRQLRHRWLPGDDARSERG